MFRLIEGLEFVSEPLMLVGELLLVAAALLIVMRWLLSSGRSKVDAMTPERREQALERRRFHDRYAHRKAADGAAEPKVYGPLSPEQQKAYQETRARLKRERKAA